MLEVIKPYRQSESDINILQNFEVNGKNFLLPDNQIQRTLVITTVFVTKGFALKPNFCYKKIVRDTSKA